MSTLYSAITPLTTTPPAQSTVISFSIFVTKTVYSTITMPPAQFPTTSAVPNVSTVVNNYTNITTSMALFVGSSDRRQSWLIGVAFAGIFGAVCLM